MFGPRDLDVTLRADGTTLVRSRQPLAPYARALPDRLAHWARERPDAIFLAERTPAGDGWRTITYAAMRRAVRSIAQALLDRGASATHGVAILAGNGIDHACVGLAAQEAGIPYAPISPPYALASTDFAKLRACIALLQPALLFVDDTAPYDRALARGVIDPAIPVIAARGTSPQRETIALDALLATTPGAALDAATAALTPDTIAKILFTSGSTGMPKGVINTQRMLCSNQQMALQAFPGWAAGPIMLDWVPWSHTAGSNQTFNMVLYNGGTMYIDDGRPTPAQFGKTVRNLREISPTIFFNVPRGFDELARALAADRELCRCFFARLEMMWYAGAALAAPVFETMRRLAIETTGNAVLMTSCLGSTETAPSALFASDPATAIAGNVGVPLPGLEMKLVPVGAKLELCLRGPSITPGYLHRDDLTAEAFDDEGYYHTGDAVTPVDPQDPSRGYLFDGRFGDDFKLTTGTWVNVAALRIALLAALQPLVRDLVVCGADRDRVSAILVADDDGETARDAIAARLAAFASEHPASSMHVARAIFLDAPTSLDAGEITDKGSLSGATIRARRPHLIALLDAPEPPPEVIVVERAR